MRVRSPTVKAQKITCPKFQYVSYNVWTRACSKVSPFLHEVDPGHFLDFGNDTVNNLESRYSKELPEDNVIGTSIFVYWPITSRFGWGQQ
jgi:hypothetical protein